MRAEITGGEVSDYKGCDALLDEDLVCAKVFIADRGYDSDAVRKTVIDRGGTPVIPARKNREESIPIDSLVHALRNLFVLASV